MPTGFFTQGVALLFEQAPFDPALEAALAPLGAVARDGTARNLFASAWAIPLGPGGRGAVLVDALPRAWPDSMGNPENDASTFLAWGAGAFGPGAWPGGLARTAQGSPEPDAVARVEKHRGVLRVRCTHALDLPDGAPLLPPDRDASAEPRAVLSVAAELLKLPGALAFYNPNAEALASPEAFARARSAAGERLPWPLLIAVRNLPLENPEGLWLLDTLGLGSQFGAPPFRDHELLLDRGRFAPAEAQRFLQGLSATAVTRGRDWQPGEEVEGPGGELWAPEERAEALVVPPRPVLRWSLARELGSAG